MIKIRQDQWIESLSAYLDGELPIPERRKLEVMLHENDILLQQLNTLEKTRALLRHAPRLKVPHNFTLTAAMLPQKQVTPFWLPLMSSSSVLAAVFLILTYVFNSPTLASPKMIENYAMDAAPMAESITASAEVAPQETASEEGAAPTEPPMIIQWFGNMAMGKGGGGGADPAPEAAILAQEAPAAAVDNSAMAEEEPLMDSAMTEILPEGITPETQMFAAEAPAPSPAEESDLSLSGETPSDATTVLPLEQSTPLFPEATQMEATSEGESLTIPTATAIPVARSLESETPLQNPILGIAPVEEQGEIIADASEYLPVPAMPFEEDSQDRTSGILILRGVLLFISLLSGTIAIFISRRQNH
jgi:anti-sigma factor RsiW